MPIKVVLLADGSIPKRVYSRLCNFRRICLRKLQYTTNLVTESLFIVFFSKSCPLDEETWNVRGRKLRRNFKNFRDSWQT